MINNFLDYLSLAAAYVRLNFKAQLAYRGAFASQVVAMFVNDCAWLAFWILFFTRFPTLSGWGVADVITMWCVVASGFGLAHGLAGNALVLPRLIVRGELDTWKLYPRALLPHVVLGSSHATAWGDFLFGFVAYVLLNHPDWQHLALFTVLVAIVAISFAGFSILSGSLAFFVGSGEALAENWRFALITFATYPASLFDGFVKLVLYTLVPAAFIGYIPVEALRNLSIADTMLALAGALAITIAGTIVFYWGLNRYESGNMLEMRG